MNSKSTNLSRTKKIEILKALRYGNKQPLLNVVDELDGCAIEMELGEATPVSGGYMYCGEFIKQSQLTVANVDQQNKKNSSGRILIVDMQL